LGKLLVSDTNSAIKIAFFADKFFEEGFISLGEVALCHEVVSKELRVHLQNPEKKDIKEQVEFLLNCNYYYEFEFEEFHFINMSTIEFQEAEDIVRRKNGFLGTSENDQKVLFIALENECHLITNEYALTELALEVIMLPDILNKEMRVFTAEDLVLCAFDECKLSKTEVQDALNRWASSGEFVINTKKQAFIERGFFVPDKGRSKQ